MENPLGFRDEIYPAKTYRGMGLPYGENFIILTSIVFLWYIRVTDRQTDRRTDGRTDGRAIAYSLRAIAYNVARENDVDLQAIGITESHTQKNNGNHLQ